jgi:pimeloyl-ACP methyl ester carboxylesterase
LSASVERGGYGFGDLAAALLRSAASADTLASAGFMQAARFIGEAEMPPLAAGLTMPLLMVQGEEDRVTPAATNAKLLAAARSSRHPGRLRSPARGGAPLVR